MRTHSGLDVVLGEEDGVRVTEASLTRLTGHQSVGVGRKGGSIVEVVVQDDFFLVGGGGWRWPRPRRRRGGRGPRVEYGKRRTWQESFEKVNTVGKQGFGEVRREKVGEAEGSV